MHTVQNTLYVMTPNAYAHLERVLLAEIDETQDNLRFYRITEPLEVRVRQYGCFRSVDFEGSLIA